MSRRLIACIWVAVLAVGVSSSLTTPADAVTGNVARFATIGALARVPANARPLGPLDRNRELSLGIALEPRAPAALAALATGVSTPGSPLFHHYLDTAGFASEFGASTATIEHVEAGLRSAGLRPGPISANRLLVPVAATVSQLDRAFRTHVVGYRLSDGTVGWATTTAPELPAADAIGVSGVVGLDNLYQPRALLAAKTTSASQRTRAESSSSRRRPTAAPTSCRTANLDARSGGGWTDSELADAYGLNQLYSAGDLGAGQTIALFELEPFLSSDVATFDRCYFAKSHAGQVSPVPVDGFGLQGAGSGESILDIEDVSALAPNARILVYEAPNTTFGAIDEYNAMVSQDRANIVSTSWGECEAALQIAAPGTEQLENSIFEEAAAQGQTFLAAAGDTGSDDCASTPFNSTIAVKPFLSVDDPADQPFVVAVGGTSLLSTETPEPAGAETVWNDGAVDGGTGGGTSSVWPSPAWQDGSAVPGVAIAGNREVPDVSASADQRRGVTVYSKAFAEAGSPSQTAGTSSGWSTIGGTSSSAPIWAAVLADIAASGVAGTTCSGLPVARGGPDLGFVAPELYGVAAIAYSSSFNDVTIGDNDIFGLGDGYSATAGYDRASGLGSPIVVGVNGAPGLAVNLCSLATGSSPSGPPRETITGLLPTFGPAAGGTPVTIGLSSPVPVGATVRVEFGAAVASISSFSGETVNVTAPAPPLAPGSAAFAGAGPSMVRILVTDNGETVSSSSAPSSVFDYVNEAGSGATVPTVTGIGPYGGNVVGGNTVTVYGSGFSTGLVTMTVGGSVASSVHVLSDYELTAVVPPETPSSECATGQGFNRSAICQTEVVVANGAGASATVPILPALAGPIVFSPQGIVDPKPGTEVAPTTTEYDYSPTPVIKSITPNPASASGESPIVIRGRGFNLVNFEWVNFGPARTSSSEQVEISFVSSTRIRIDPPGASSEGPQLLRGGVSVQTTGGLSNVVRFKYAGIPVLHKLSPTRGPTIGGTAITLTGNDLAGVEAVNFVPESAKSVGRIWVTTAVSHNTASSVRVVAPPALSGPVDVEACTASGCSKPDPATDTFVYYAPSRPSG